MKSPFATALFTSVILFTLGCSQSRASQLTCKDVTYGSPSYNEKMDELAKLAHLPDNAWNRYHESLVRGLCSGSTKDVDSLVNDGYIKSQEASAVAKILGKAYTPKSAPSATNKSYAAAKARFVELGACSACADNIAQHYSKTPNSPCGKLAQKALDGDPDAIKTVVDFPDYCKSQY